MMRNARSLALADGGIETELMGRLSQDLPEFAAFVLLENLPGRAALEDYFSAYLRIADEYGRDLVLDTPTWRASSDWGTLLGYDAAHLARINTDAVSFLRVLGEQVAPDVFLTVNGCVGPRTDEYVPAERMTAAEAQRYHQPQVDALADSGADRISGVTIPDVPEAIGLTKAARVAGIPVTISLVVDDAGRLADGHTLAEAIAAIDAATESEPLFYLVNCAHSEEVGQGLGGEPQLNRLGGLRLNAARADQGEEDADTPEEFAAALLRLADRLRGVVLLGGCCGTDARHIRAIAAGLAA